jgi:hypothetical protein
MRRQTGFQLTSIVIGYNGILAMTLLTTTLTSAIVSQLHLQKVVEPPFSGEQIAKIEEKTIDASENAWNEFWQTMQQLDKDAKHTIYKYVGNLSDL